MAQLTELRELGQFPDVSPVPHTLRSEVNKRPRSPRLFHVRAGDAQPENFPPNERGYGNNGWRAHAVDVTVS